MTALCLAVLGLLVLEAAVPAQPPDGPAGGLQGVLQQPGKNVRARKEELQELLSTVYLMELTKQLELSKSQAIDVAKLIDKQQKAKKADQKAFREAMRGIRYELGKDKPSKKQLSKLIAEAKAARDRMRRFETETRDAILAKLTVTQQAKFILFHARWMKKMNRIKEFIKQRRMRRGHRGYRQGREGPMPPGPAPGR